MRKNALALIAIALSIASAGAQDRMYFENANPPYAYARDNEAAGLYPEIVREIYRRLGRDIELVPAPWQRALYEARHASTGIGGLIKNAEREPWLDFSNAIYTEKFAVYQSVGAREIESVDGLAGLSVGVIRGWSYGNAMDALFASGIVRDERNISEKANLMKLGQGRVNAVIAIEDSGDALVRELGLADRVRKTRVAFSVDIYIAFSKSLNMADDLGKINAVIESLRSDGTIDAIKAREVKVKLEP
jgi:polar amino acid transport system substrate-binding protein